MQTHEQAVKLERANARVEPEIRVERGALGRFLAAAFRSGGTPPRRFFIVDGDDQLLGEGTSHSEAWAHADRNIELGRV